MSANLADETFPALPDIITGSGISAPHESDSPADECPDFPEPPLSAYADDMPPDMQGDMPDMPDMPDLHGDEIPYIAPYPWDTFKAEINVSTWADPLEISDKIYQGLPFNTAWVPNALGDYASDVARRMGGDPGAVIMGQIAACCACADDGFYTTPKLHDLGWKERARIWTLAVGLSASKKTWLLQSGIRPAEALDTEITRRYLDKKEKFDYAEESYQVLRAKAAKAGDPMPQREIERPQHEHIFLNESTIEGIRSGLLDSPRGIGIFRDEFAGLVKDLDRYTAKGGGGDRYAYLELHNGGMKKIGRVGNFIPVPNWSAVLTGCLTPISLKASLADLQEDGLLQRFLICMVRTAGADVDAPADLVAQNAYTTTLKVLRDQSAGSEGHHIPFSPEAYAVRMEFNEIQNALANGDIPPPMAAAIRKWEAFFPRLCLLFHLIDLAVQGRHPGLSERISGETAERVRDVLLWQYSHLQEFWLSTMSAGEGHRMAQRVASYILAHRITDYQHNKHCAMPHFREWDRLSNVDRHVMYSTLENAGWLERHPNAKQNTDKIWNRWNVNPKVHEKFRQQAESERKRRAEVATRLTNERAAWLASRSGQTSASRDHDQQP